MLIPLTELTRSYFGGSGNGLDLIIYGVLIMAVALARPEGLTSLLPPARDAAGAARMSAPLLEVRNVTRRFGGLVANSDVSLSVAAGEILGLIGPNGAGKSTLFNMIAGLYPPTSGTHPLRRRGHDAARRAATLRPRHRAHLPGGAELRFDVRRRERARRQPDARARAPRRRAARRRGVLARTGLSRQAEAPASELTPPEKRRLEIARASATEPKLLLLDEALTGLTPAEARQGVELVREIRRGGVTIIMVEHVMEVVMPLVDRAVVLDLGKVLAQGLPQDVVRDETVIGAYLGERHRAA